MTRALANLNPAVPEVEVVNMVNYDQEDGQDDQGAIANARDVKLPFNKNDIRLWFSLVESKMEFAGIKAQWSKRQVLIQLILADLHNDFKTYLIMQKTDAGATPYFDLKSAIIKQLGLKKADGFDKAISRVMTGTPSQLGRQIINDICPKVKPLEGCCCSDTVLGIWRRSLPSVVRNAVADMDFTANTFSAVFDKADKVWTSNGASTTVVAALTKTPEEGGAEVAATSRGGRRGGRGNRGGGRGNRGGGQNRGGGSGSNQGGGARDRGPRHPDQPPREACDVHWKFGKAAWHCADRHKCPWRDYENPKPRHNRNIAATEETD